MDVFKISDVTSAKNVSLDELQGYMFKTQVHERCILAG